MDLVDIARQQSSRLAEWSQSVIASVADLTEDARRQVVRVAINESRQATRRWIRVGLMVLGTVLLVGLIAAGIRAATRKREEDVERNRDQDLDLSSSRIAS